MTETEGTSGPPNPADLNIVWHPGELERSHRWERLGASGATLWFTGLSGSGKSTIAAGVERRLVEAGRSAYILDGDNLRHGINAGLSFSAADRNENVRRSGEVARLFADAGMVALVPLISPYRAMRDRVREAHHVAGLPFYEVFVNTPIEICEQRDPKGLYKMARAGEIKGFTGIDDPYEAPQTPELILTPDGQSADDQADEVIDWLSKQ